MSGIKRVCCKECFFLQTGNGSRGGVKGKCRVRRPNENRIGSRTACIMFRRKEV